MVDLVQALDVYKGAIFILLVVGGLLAFRWLWVSWREWQMSVYKLEREFAMRRLSQSLTFSLLVVILLCAESTLVVFVIPGLPASFFIPTPTLDVLAQPQGTLSPEMMTQGAAAPQPAVSANMQGCVPDQIMISSPKPGEEIKGKVDVKGTVNIPNFGFYKYEVALRGSDTWATILAGTTVVINDKLGQWDTTALTPGDYQLRVVITDNKGTSLSPCIIPIRVLAP
jgi:hypothetical protein